MRPRARLPAAPAPRADNKYDHFGVGHASTAISAALGMASAAALKGESRRVVAIIQENALRAGAGSGVGELLATQGQRIPLLQLGIPDGVIENGTREACLAMLGLDAAGLTVRIESAGGMPSGGSCGSPVVSVRVSTSQ